MLKTYSDIKTTKENKKYVERRLKDFKVKKYLIDEDDTNVKFVFFDVENGAIANTIVNELGGTFKRI